MLSSGSRNPDEDGETTEDTEITEKKLMEQPTKSGRNKNVNRYNLHFYQETKRDLDMMRSLAFKPLIPAQSKDREIDLKYFEGYDFPLRPQWSYDMAKETLEQNENKYFRVGLFKKMCRVLLIKKFLFFRNI